MPERGSIREVSLREVMRRIRDIEEALAELRRYMEGK